MKDEDKNILWEFSYVVQSKWLDEAYFDRESSIIAKDFYGAVEKFKTFVKDKKLRGVEIAKVEAIKRVDVD